MFQFAHWNPFTKGARVTIQVNVGAESDGGFSRIYFVEIPIGTGPAMFVEFWQEVDETGEPMKAGVRYVPLHDAHDEPCYEQAHIAAISFRHRL
jgi:hypothetical protein